MLREIFSTLTKKAQRHSTRAEQKPRPRWETASHASPPIWVNSPKTAAQVGFQFIFSHPGKKGQKGIFPAFSASFLQAFGSPPPRLCVRFTWRMHNGGEGADAVFLVRVENKPFLLFTQKAVRVIKTREECLQRGAFKAHDSDTDTTFKCGSKIRST